MQVKIKCFADEEIAVIKDGKVIRQPMDEGNGGIEPHEPHEPHEGFENGEAGGEKKCEKMVIKRIAPDKFLLMKVGKIKYSQEGKGGEFELTPEDIKNIIDKFNERQKDLVVDYEHGTLDSSAPFKGEAPAAGWIESLELTDAGLVAKVKNWSDKARGLLENGEYRYHSPVLIFDDKTNRPVEIQSVGLTNHPAIHGIPALVAASDTGKNTMNIEDKKSVFGKFKDLLVQLKGGIESFSDVFESTMRDTETFVKGDAELEKEFVAFNDATFAGFNIKAFADGNDVNAMAVESAPSEDGNMVGQKVDIWSQIMANRESMNGATLLDWIERELSSVKDIRDKGMLEAERKRLMDFKNTYPDLWEKGLTSATPQTADYILKNEEANKVSIPMSDIRSFVSVNGDNKEEMISGIKAMSDKVRTATMYLKMNDVKSFEELDNKLKKERDELNKKIKDAEGIIQMNDINKEIDKAIADGRLVEATRESAIELAKSNRKALTDFIAKQPVHVASFESLIENKAVPFSDTEVRRQHVSKTQLNAANAFGIDVGDVNWKQTF